MEEILASGSPAVPATVRDAVGARLARTSAEACEVVEAAAVIGAHVDRSVLAEVSGLPGSIDAALASGILLPDERRVRFRHELVRLAVEDSIAPGRAAELHATVLARLISQGDAEVASLAHHAEGAGDSAAVLRFAPPAARRSSALGAHREAAAQYERALRWASDAEPAVVASLHEGLAEEYCLLDRWEEAETALQDALGLRRDLGDDLHLGEDLHHLARTLWRLCRGDESREAAHAAVRVLEGLPPGKRPAWAYAYLAALYQESEDAERAIEVGEQHGG